MRLSTVVLLFCSTFRSDGVADDGDDAKAGETNWF